MCGAANKDMVSNIHEHTMASYDSAIHKKSLALPAAGLGCQTSSIELLSIVLHVHTDQQYRIALYCTACAYRPAV